MRKELDQELCKKKFPEMFANGRRPQFEMWGFDCKDGWYNIIDILCTTIQHHIDQNIEALEWTTNFNKELAEAEANNWEGWNSAWAKTPRDIPELIEQVVVTQVKEKYGTLRFYYNGGDEYIRGAVTMAELMSARTCETCGDSGKTRSGPWLRTLCDTHAKEYNYPLENGEEV
jgi:hypothetical protein